MIGAAEDFLLPVFELFNVMTFQGVMAMVLDLPNFHRFLRTFLRQQSELYKCFKTASSPAVRAVCRSLLSRAVHLVVSRTAPWDLRPPR